MAEDINTLLGVLAVPRRFTASILLVLAACAAARPVREVSPTALRGVTLGLPPTAGLSASTPDGCGQQVSDLSLQTGKLLVESFSAAGAQPSLSSRAPWTLNVTITDAGMGADYRRSKFTPTQWQGEEPGVNQIPPAGTEGGLNGAMGRATVALDATLLREGQLIWRGTVSGHADSVPCGAVRQKLHEALVDAVSALREQVIRQVHLAP